MTNKNIQEEVVKEIPQLKVKKIIKPIEDQKILEYLSKSSLKPLSKPKHYLILWIKIKKAWSKLKKYFHKKKDL